MAQPSHRPCNREVPLFNDPGIMCEFYNSLLSLESSSCSVHPYYFVDVMNVCRRCTNDKHIYIYIYVYILYI